VRAMALAEALEEVFEDGSGSDTTWTRREQARQRQIAIGKARPEYRRYAQEVPREIRDASHPSTPDPRARISKRQFDRTLSAWRCRLHEYDVPRVAAEGSRGDAEITPLHSRRASHMYDDLDNVFAEHRASGCFPSHGEDGGVVPLRLADALLAVAGAPLGTPVTPQVGTGHHHFCTQPLLTGLTHLQLGPRQLDFGAVTKQAWQPCSPMDATPSTMCTLSPITPAPRSRPILQGGRHQTVFENETPDRPYQPIQQSFHAFSQQQFLPEEAKAVYRHHSPVTSRKSKTGEDTPPVTPPRKFDLGCAEELHPGDGSAESDPSSARRHDSPPSSVAKTPSYGYWVRSTPSPQGIYRSNTYSSCYAENTGHACLETRPHCISDVASMLPQQPQYPMHHLHTVPWAMYPGAC